MGLWTASPRGSLWGTPSAWPVYEAYIYKHHLLAGDSLWRQYRCEHNIRGAGGEYIHPLLRLHWRLFEACILVRVQFLSISWRALARHLRSVWIRVLVIWHPMTHTIFAFFVWAKSTHAMSLRGKSAWTVSFFLWKSSALVCPSFRGKSLLPAILDPPLPKHGGEWNRGVRSWIWPIS